MIKRVPRGEMMPPWYGIAWFEYENNEGVCLPVPLNLVAAMVRSSWFFLRHGWRSLPQSPRDAYRQGLRDARKRDTEEL